MDGLDRRRLSHHIHCHIDSDSHYYRRHTGGLLLFPQATPSLLAPAFSHILYPAPTGPKPGRVDVCPDGCHHVAHTRTGISHHTGRTDVDELSREVPGRALAHYPAFRMAVYKLVAPQSKCTTAGQTRTGACRVTCLILWRPIKKGLQIS